MKTRISCPGCGQKITVNEAVMGKRGKCPTCGKSLTIPTAEQFQAAASRKIKPAESVEPVAAAEDPLWNDEELGGDLFGEAVDTAAASPATRTLSAAPKAKSKKPKPQRPKTWRAFGGMVLGVVLMVAVIPTSIAALFVAGQMTASNSWPSVEGRIMSAHVRVVGFGKKKKYQAEVRYDYEVKSRWHVGSRIRLGDTTGSSESAQQALVDKYVPGTQVKVYYDPEWPEQSVLEPGGWPIKMLIPPILLAGIGWLFFGVSTGRIKS